MASLLTIIILISLVATIILAVSSIKVRRGSRKKLIKSLGASLVVAFMALLALGMTDETEESNGNSNSKKFDFIVEEYEKNAISAINDLKGTSFISVDEVEIEDPNTHTIKLMNGIKLAMRLNNKEQIEDVNVLATASTFSVYNKEVRIAFQSLIKSVDPSLTTPQQLTIMDKLELDWNSSMLDKATTYDFNGITYNYIGNPDNQILMLQASPK